MGPYGPISTPFDPIFMIFGTRDQDHGPWARDRDHGPWARDQDHGPWARDQGPGPRTGDQDQGPSRDQGPSWAQDQAGPGTNPARDQAGPPPNPKNLDFPSENADFYTPAIRRQSGGNPPAIRRQLGGSPAGRATRPRRKTKTTRTLRWSLSGKRETKSRREGCSSGLVP